MIGREPGVELGNTICQAYDEVDIEDFDTRASKRAGEDDCAARHAAGHCTERRAA